ncbi:colipase isoform X2 [Hemicordylus capensis]|uniref:colipase isoform X2 n=1 Tax=Hemicordylus capensis TaxID=884348 RepID=UPI0023023492|nr:colipase isoform X2 [Hemicordylus capensis]
MTLLDCNFHNEHKIPLTDFAAMKKILGFLLLVFALATAFAHERGLFFNLNNGEMCAQSVQCKSKCCHRHSGLSLARCADKAAENQKCSLKHIVGVYYECPCENGLSCDADRTIVGSITNSDFGVCYDPSRK